MVAALIIIVSAFILTTIYTAIKMPTSTIQILVFCVVGMAFGAGIAAHWITILKLAVIWIIAPPIALGLGYAFTHGLDKIVGFKKRQSARQMVVIRILRSILVSVGVAASFTMGANDVANATGVFIITHLFNVWMASFIGGIGLFIGVLTWGKPLLKKVALDIVHIDLSMASAAQFVQALVVFFAVSLGFFTSMNQALIGAMTGAGLARGTGSIEWKTVWNIVKAWLIGPLSGIILAFALTKVAEIWFAV